MVDARVALELDVPVDMDAKETYWCGTCKRTKEYSQVYAL